jgi:hypothetical protein
MWTNKFDDTLSSDRELIHKNRDNWCNWIFKTSHFQDDHAEGHEEEDTSDMSLDESDLSDASTTEVSSEHSDWGSDHGDGVKTPTQITPSKKRSPKNKKKRRAAQKCRELVRIWSFSTW